MGQGGAGRGWESQPLSLRCSNAPIQEARFPNPRPCAPAGRANQKCPYEKPIRGRQDTPANEKVEGARPGPSWLGGRRPGRLQPRSLALRCALSRPAVRVPLCVLLARGGGDPEGWGSPTEARAQTRLPHPPSPFFWSVLPGRVAGETRQMADGLARRSAPAGRPVCSGSEPRPGPRPSGHNKHRPGSQQTPP